GQYNGPDVRSGGGGGPRQFQQWDACRLERPGGQTTATHRPEVSAQPLGDGPASAAHMRLEQIVEQSQGSDAGQDGSVGRAAGAQGQHGGAGDHQGALGEGHGAAGEVRAPQFGPDRLEGRDRQGFRVRSAHWSPPPSEGAGPEPSGPPPLGAPSAERVSGSSGSRAWASAVVP